MDSDSDQFWIWAIIIIIILFLMSGTNDNPYDTCYDADPSQYQDIVC
jgi:hypothetical protein